MSWLPPLQPMHWALLAWTVISLAVLLVAFVRTWRADRARPDFRDTGDFMLGADAWCHVHPDAARQVQTSAPTPALTLGHRRAIDADARAAARRDFDQGRRRANPHRRHSREFACWAISYSDTWTSLELATATVSPTAPGKSC